MRYEFETPEGWTYVLRSEYEIDGVGHCVVETVEFPTVPEGYFDRDEPGDIKYTGFESVLTLPDGRQLGHGPEESGETTHDLHETWDETAIREAWLGLNPTGRGWWAKP